MGNYKDLEYDFIDRTLKLIEQYEGYYKKFKFDEQYNHTLLINCLLGLIVMPKERVIDAIPKQKLTPELKKEMGIENSIINPEISEFKNLIIQLRHAVAHFKIEVRSDDNVQFLIDEIFFLNPEKGNDYVIVKFRSEELLYFVRYYASWLLKNMKDKRPVQEKPVRARKH